MMVSITFCLDADPSGPAVPSRRFTGPEYEGVSPSTIAQLERVARDEPVRMQHELVLRFLLFTVGMVFPPVLLVVVSF